MAKIKSLQEIEKIVAGLRGQGRKIVTTNGAFDILHVGHIKYLKEAREMGDILIVGVNTDQSIKRYKSHKRPINELGDRMEVLQALECVDYVFSFDEDDPRTWLEKLKPDFHVKGGDYNLPLIEQQVVEKNGGKVVLIPPVEGKSATSLIKKIREVG